MSSNEASLIDKKMFVTDWANYTCPDARFHLSAWRRVGNSIEVMLGAEGHINIQGSIQPPCGIGGLEFEFTDPYHGFIEHLGVKIPRTTIRGCANFEQKEVDE